MSDSSPSDESGHPGESAVAVEFVGPGRTAEQLKTACSETPVPLVLTAHAETVSNRADDDTADCLVLEDGRVTAEQLSTIDLPIILFTRDDPMELAESAVSVAQTVHTQRSSDLSELVTTIHRETRRFHRQESSVTTAVQTGSVEAMQGNDELHEELERFDRILDGVDGPICTFDDTLQFQYVNRAFESLTGFETANTRDESLDLLFADADVVSIRESIEELRDADSGSARTVEATAITSNEEEIPVEVRLRLLPGESSDRIVAILHDITRLKQREERLSKFASVVSHDLRNPLDVALGRAEMLPEIADLDEETEKHLDDIYFSLKRMEQLIEDVLTLTRQREDSVDTEPISLEDSVEVAWNSVATENAELVIDTSCEIYAHQSRLVRLLENLFRNAISHGGEDVSVTVAAQEMGESIVLTVSDDGPGIVDENKPKIFEDGFTTSTQGTGLGLAIVTEVARGHDWEVSIEDAEDGGARFLISGIQPVRDEQ